MTDTATVPTEILGPLLVEADRNAVLRIRFGVKRSPADAPPGSLAARAAAELAEYFAGERTAFDVPPDWSRIDPESAHVLATLLQVAPFGHTVSYGELAAAAGLGDPVASRAVGQVLNANPWPVIVPCHRVVMADGSLGGFGGGVWRKEALLRFEGVLPATLFDGPGTDRGSTDRAVNGPAVGPWSPTSVVPTRAVHRPARARSARRPGRAQRG